MSSEPFASTTNGNLPLQYDTPQLKTVMTMPNLLPRPPFPFSSNAIFSTTNTQPSARRCQSLDMGILDTTLITDEDILKFLEGGDDTAENTSHEEEYSSTSLSAPPSNRFAIASYGKETKSPNPNAFRQKLEPESAKLKRKERNRVLALESRKRKEQGMELLVKENDILRNRNKMLSEALTKLAENFRHSNASAEDKSLYQSLIRDALGYSLMEVSPEIFDFLSMSACTEVTSNSSHMSEISEQDSVVGDVITKTNYA